MLLRIPPRSPLQKTSKRETWEPQMVSLNKWETDTQHEQRPSFMQQETGLGLQWEQGPEHSESPRELS